MARQRHCGVSARHSCFCRADVFRGPAAKSAAKITQIGRRPPLSLIRKAPRMQDFLGDESLPGALGERFPCNDVHAPGAVRAFGDYGRLKTTSTLREMHHNPHAPGTLRLSQDLPD